MGINPQLGPHQKAQPPIGIAAIRRQRSSWASPIPTAGNACLVVHVIFCQRHLQKSLAHTHPLSISFSKMFTFLQSEPICPLWPTLTYCQITHRCFLMSMMSWTRLLIPVALPLFILTPLSHTFAPHNTFCGQSSYIRLAVI